MSKTVRITADLPQESIERLKMIAKQSNTSLTQSIIRSIQVQKAILNEIDGGAKLLLIDSQDNVSRVSFPRSVYK